MVTITSRAMGSQLIALFFLLALLNLTIAQGSYDDCCLKYAPKVKERVRNPVVRYRTQGLGGGCNIPAIVFTLKKGRQLCGNPQDPRVKKLMLKVDRLKLQKKPHQQWPNRFISYSLQ